MWKHSGMNAGDLAPDFELPDETGTPRRLSDLLATGPVVLFFYPAAMTTGCTAESCHFRDLKAEFERVGAQRVGISVDPVDKQKRFSDKHAFDFPLLSDSDGSVARAFGVKRRFLVPVKRTTFVIDTDRRIREVISSELRMNAHADRALAALSASGPYPAGSEPAARDEPTPAG
jgi:peroxiredoxin Q/BCP